MKLLETLNWRYATKRYDSSKKISPSALEEIKTAIQLAPSSYGLQLYQVLHIKEVQLREQLKAAAYQQPQITEAAELFVFCHFDNATSQHIDHYIELKAKTQGVPKETLAAYGETIKGSIVGLPEEQKQIWMAKQVYIALANGITASANLGIDSSPMEGFDKAAFDEILALKSKGLQSAVILALGYRSEEDETQHQAKVRKPLEALFTAI